MAIFCMYCQDLRSFGKILSSYQDKNIKTKTFVSSYIRFLNYFKCTLSPRLKLYSPLISPMFYTELKQ